MKLCPSNNNQQRRIRHTTTIRWLVVLLVVNMSLLNKVSVQCRGSKGNSLAFITTRTSSSSSSSMISSTTQQANLFGSRQRQITSFYSTTKTATTTALFSTATSSDQSAMSKSRKPFRMPKNSHDDSAANNNTNQNPATKGSDPTLSWNRLGLLTELCTTLQQELQLKEPTSVQSLVIPQLLNTTKESIAFLAATGSGKTLAYVLPIIQQLKQQEMFHHYERRSKRPRCLILVPTRELAIQITTVIKELSHTVKLSTQSLIGGLDKGIQRKAIENRPVDIIVATPGRLLYHWKNNNIFLGSIQTIVLDEMDTMLEQGFVKEIRDIVYPLLYTNTKNPKEIDSSEEQPQVKDNAPQIIMTSATMTQSIQKLVGDNPKTSNLSITAKRLYKKVGTDSTSISNNEDSASIRQEQNIKFKLPKMKIISAPGLHKAIPRLEQIFVDVGNTDKISLLLDVIASSNQKSKATIIFCNTASSVRAVQYALAEARIDSLAYHGELNSIARTENLQRFRKGAASIINSSSNTGASRGNIVDEKDYYLVESEGLSNPNILVCTDIAARGLDIPEVDSVIMFDFPLNAMDYLHRSGRTARGAGQGKVTALVTKRDEVLATAIEQAVLRGEALDGLSSRKSDYQPGARLGVKPKDKNIKKMVGYSSKPSKGRSQRTGNGGSQRRTTSRRK